MHLGVDIRCLQDEWRTGVGQYSWNTLRALAELEPSWRFKGYANAAGKIGLPQEISHIMQVVRRRWPNRLNNLLSWFKLGPTLQQHLTEQGDTPDLVWLPNPLFAKLNRAAAVVLTVHDLSFLHYPQFFPRRGRLWYFPMVRRLLQRDLPSQARLVAVSEHTADDLIEQFPRFKGRVNVAYPGVDPVYFERPSFEAVAQVRQSYQLPEQYLLSVGTVEPRKNYELLLRVYDELVRREPNFQHDLVIAGAWGWRFEGLKALYRQLPSRSRIHFLGYVREEDKPALYAEASLFLYPSFYEGFGMPPLEAMAAGVPVLASHSSSLPEVVGESGLLLSPMRLNHWLEAVRWLMADAGARADLARAGQARARRFSWQKTAEVYRDLFSSLVN